ncbi:hypothetical protein JL101_028835 (plasmid) [Skermanella rosea]|uniref:hypothetical protein n=1 Tax=Skermanella rosea TaxID=1817965 RepID=UPI001933EC02|nr:hypothetical protein [Skermanella rosea]UEM07017.1 hypothetical protein JL101_028835 [Skermanella rosea]
MGSYSIQITMDQDTLTDLIGSGFRLLVFKAVCTTMGGGAPVVWFQTTGYSLSNTVGWNTSTEAYTSPTASTTLAQGQPVVASTTYSITAGQTLQVTSAAGTGEVVANGSATEIYIDNTTTSEFLCGLCQQLSWQGVGGAYEPTFALPLYGGIIDVVTPAETVLIAFDTDPLTAGMAAYQLLSPALLVDFSETGETTLDVTYAINTNWAANTAACYSQVAAGEELAPLLFLQSDD